MASAKVIYTYKRKRLSSCVGVGHVAVSPDYTSNFEDDKCQNAGKERSENLEKDLKRTCHSEKLLHTCSSPREHQENDSARDSDAKYKSETVLNSYDLPGEKTVKTSSENILTEVGNIFNSVIDVNSLLPHNDDQSTGTPVTQSEKKQNSLCDSEHVKARVNAPLLTFSRRLKRKVDKKIVKELTIKEGKLMGMYTDMCEVSSSKDKCVKEPLDLNDGDDLEIKNLLCTSNDEMDNRETSESLHPHSGSCLESLKNTSSENELNVDISSVTKTLGSNTDDVRYNMKENIECSSNDRNATNKSDDCRVSYQLQVSDGKSQLTSNSLEQKISSGDFVIDCNTIPMCDLQEQESDSVLHSSLMIQSHGDAMEEGCTKTKGLELFGLHVVQSNNSLLQDSRPSVEGETKPEIKCLELFSEDVKKDNDVCTKAKQTLTYAPHIENDWLERSSNIFLGLSPPIEPSLGQSSKHGDHNIVTREFIHPSFIDHTTSLAFKRKKLLERINTETTSLRGNANVSLVNFESCPTMWTEEELDSLWIGIRRHGRGNWLAMLLDPRLTFAPWRAPKDLGIQWEQEQVKLLNGQHMFPGPYNIGHGVGFSCSTSGCMREKLEDDTRLSLGDVYAHNTCSYIGNGGPHSLGFKHIVNPRMVESHSYGRPEMGLATNNVVPHWFREIHVAPGPLHPGPLEPTLPQIRAHSLVHTYPQPYGMAYESRNLIDNGVHLGLMIGGEVHPRTGFPNPGPSMVNQGMNNDPIVINSDDSSEETISDDHNIHS